MYETKANFLESISRRGRKGYEPQYEVEVPEVQPSTERSLGATTIEGLITVNQSSSIQNTETK